jgi:flagella basal body P-ring formation protein FlgA
MSRLSILRALPWAFSLAMTAPVIAAPVRIELPGSAVVTGQVVTLGQVAYITSTDLTVMRRLLALPLGNAPAAGGVVTLDRTALSRWLRARAGLRSHDVEWLGENRVAVHRISRQVGSEDVVSTARSALSAWLGDRSDRFELSALTNTRAVEVPQGRLRLAVRPIAYERPLRRMQIWVDVWSGDEAVRTVPVVFEVKAYTTAAVAQRDVGLGDTPDRLLQDGEVDLTARPTRARPLTVSDLAGLDEPRLRRPVRAGDAVTEADIESSPAVQRGERLALRMTQGPLIVESHVEVLHDAEVGQNVRVRSSQADGPALARVTGRGQLELMP